jgi:hypothetical protein
MEPTLVAPSDAAPVDAPVETDSLSDHEAQFGSAAEPAERTDAEPADKVEPKEDKGRHRAQSQKATPADVPRINSLTKQLRAAQAELERLKASTAAAPAPAQAEQPRQATPAPRQAAPVAELLKSPDVSKDALSESEFFERYPDEAYGTYQRYLSRYAVVEYAESQREAATKAQRGHVEQHVTDITAERNKQFGEDVSAYVATKPDFAQRLQDAGPLVNAPLPPLLLEALVASGPEMYYHLVCNPALLADMHFLSDGKPATDANVAILQRRLTSELTRTQAATTGSVAAPQTRTSAPRPPNPVRTGSLNTGDELPDDKSDSLDAHMRAYKPKRR